MLVTVVSFKMAATLLNVAITSKQNNYMLLFFIDSRVLIYTIVFKCHHFEYYSIISHAHMQHKRSV